MFGSCPVIPFVVPCLFYDIANTLADGDELTPEQVRNAQEAARKLQ
jgi:hypothetical protein